MSDFTIKALTSETFDDFAALVERNGGMFAGCWCTRFHPNCAEKGQSREGNRALKQRLVAEGVAHAALVYDGDRAVAWSRATRTTPPASGRRTPRSSTTAPARCTSAKASPTTDPRARATA